jgi:Sec-independent protein secretion pathway component TatC
MFVPLQLLYEISVWIAWYWEQPDRAKARKRLVIVLLAILVTIILIWVGIRDGLPWLRQHGWFGQPH